MSCHTVDLSSKLATTKKKAIWSDKRMAFFLNRYGFLLRRTVSKHTSFASGLRPGVKKPIFETWNLLIRLSKLLEDITSSAIPIIWHFLLPLVSLCLVLNLYNLCLAANLTCITIIFHDKDKSHSTINYSV